MPGRALLRVEAPLSTHRAADLRGRNKVEDPRALDIDARAVAEASTVAIAGGGDPDQHLELVDGKQHRSTRVTATRERWPWDELDATGGDRVDRRRPVMLARRAVGQASQSEPDETHGALDERCIELGRRHHHGCRRRWLGEEHQTHIVAQPSRVERRLDLRAHDRDRSARR
jgi:hypothetical protein